MAKIQIISTPQGHSSCGGYFFRTAKEAADAFDAETKAENPLAGKTKIKPGQVVEVPDDELDMHLATGLVMPYVERMPRNKKPKPRTQPTKDDVDAADAIAAIQRA